MVRQILELVNGALRRVGQSPLTAAELDGGTERHQVMLREAVREIWERITGLKRDDFKMSFEVELRAGQVVYSLGFPPEQLSDCELFCVEGRGAPFALRHIPEVDMLRRLAGDLGSIEDGQPREWFLTVGAVPNMRELRFHHNPDGNYTVRGQYQLAAGALSAYTLTPGNELADRVIRTHLEWALQAEDAFPGAELFAERHREAWEAYAGTPAKLNVNFRFARPFQI